MIRASPRSTKSTAPSEEFGATGWPHGRPAGYEKRECPHPRDEHGQLHRGCLPAGHRRGRAIVNGGSIRADALIQPGVLTKRDVLSILPFNNKVLKIELTGATLRAALEHGVGSIGVEAQPGRFPQVSGLRFSYDASRKPGERVTNVTVNGRPLLDRQKYTLAATNYVIKDGGDGYTMFRDAKVLVGAEQAPSESDILQKAITSVRPIAPKVEGRVRAPIRRRVRLHVSPNATQLQPARRLLSRNLRANLRCSRRRANPPRVSLRSGL